MVTAPYTLAFDTRQFSNGTHTIGAYAWDIQRTVVTATTVTVQFDTNPGNPAQTGLWSGVFSWPLVSVHINLLKNGVGSGSGLDDRWNPIFRCGIIC